MLFINTSATSAMMFTPIDRSIHTPVGRSIPTEKPLKYYEKDANAVRKHCHQQTYSFDFFSFL